jgi:DNA-binding transcriptional LysR family regulator
MFDDLNDIRLLVEVVRKGAVTKGAAALGIPAATASRKLALLEKQLGARLLERTARHFQLTDIGQAYYAAALRVLEDIEQASAALSGLNTTPGGHLHIAAPPDFATFFMAPAIASFSAKYPDVHISIQLSSKRVDLLEEGFDVAVRMGTLKDSNLVSRHLITLTRSFYASKAYVAKNGILKNPDEVASATNIILEAYSGYAEIMLQRVDKPSIKQAIHADGQIRLNSLTMLRQLLLAGAGIGLVPDRLMDEDVREGRMINILPGWRAPDIDARLLYRHRTLVPQTVRLFVEHLVQSFRET